MFLWRRRRGLAWAAIVGGGGVLLGRYALTRFMEWQASASEERALKEGLKRQFLTNQADCVDTVVRFLDHLRQQLDATVSVDAVTEEIKTRGASLSREEKIALWERVKVLSTPLFYDPFPMLMPTRPSLFLSAQVLRALHSPLTRCLSSPSLFARK